MTFVLDLQGLLIEPGKARLHRQAQPQAQRALAARVRENLELPFAYLEVIENKQFDELLPEIGTVNGLIEEDVQMPAATIAGPI